MSTSSPPPNETWTRVYFKDSKVFVKTDPSGRILLDRGLAQIKYQDKPDAKVYNANPRNITSLEAYKSKKKQLKQDQKPAEDENWKPSKLPEDGIAIYTDGACTGNPGPSGLGVVLQSGTHLKEISRFLGEGTNNIAELTAILAALQAVRQPTVPIVIYTDSSYAIGVLTKGWKAKENTQLIQKIKTKMRSFPNLKFCKVPGHAGIPENERADELAREAIARGK